MVALAMNTEHLKTDNNFSDADAFYAELTEAHRQLNSADSERLNARLVLLLANHVGDNRALSEAINIASQLQPAS